MSVSCDIDQVHDFLPTWMPLALSASGIPLCGVFTITSMKYYRRIMFVRQDGGRSCRTSVTTPEPSGYLASAWSKCVAFSVEAWPRTVNQVLASLAALSWISLLIDQVVITAYDMALIFVCPQYDCRNATMAKTPGCVASTLYRAIPTLQTLGYCFFSLTSINRFVSAYSILSLQRTRATRLGTVVTVSITIFRLCTLPFLDHMAYVPVSWSSHEFAQNAQFGSSQLATAATTLYLLGYFSFFIIVAMADIPCTVLAVQYTIQCRRELKNAHNQDDLGLMTSGKVVSTSGPPNGAAVQGTLAPGSRIMATSCDSERGPAPKSPTPSFQRSSFKRAIMGTFSQRRKNRNQATQAVTTRIVALVGLKVALLAIFVLVRSLLSHKLSAHTSTSLMTLTLKLVVAVASWTITSLTQLVALNR